MATRPVFQHQGPAGHCVIQGSQLGWKSCTAYSMAMLIDAATGGAKRPKGCKVRRLVRPRDLVEGLTLSQVAAVAVDEYGVRVTVRTGGRAIPVAAATRRIRNGRGFVLQGCNDAFAARGNANHAVYVHEVRGGSPDEPEEALVFDPVRQRPEWWKWHKVLAFGAALRLDRAGTRRLGAGRLYAGFAPRSATPEEIAELPAPKAASSGAALRFDADAFPKRRTFVADPPRGHRVNVRRRPDRLERRFVVDTLGRGDRFEGWQRTRTGARPPGASSNTWIGNEDGTEWVHRSGLRRLGTKGEALPPEEPAVVDADEDAEEAVPDADTLPDDIRNGDVMPPGEAGADQPAAESDDDAPPDGAPPSDEEVEQLEVTET